MHTYDENLKKQIEKTMLDFVSIKTHTGTNMETNADEFYKKWFNESKYFQRNPENWGLYPLKNDHLNRNIPWGLVKGIGNETIVLIHHYDTVDTLDFGKYENYAYDPIAFTEKLKEGSIPLPEDAKADLESGHWLFGRGCADMKGGASIELSLIDKYSNIDHFKGNILVIGVPDEENLSAGMRSAAYLLEELKLKFKLNYSLMINTEPHDREHEDVGIIHDGSIGKVMPLIYVKGKLSHVSKVYEGFNPTLLLSEIVKRTELSPEFIDTVGEFVSPPPTWLYMKDRKKVYDVSLPLSAGGYMSVLPLKSSPKEILDLLVNISVEAFHEVIDYMNDQYSIYMNKLNKKYKPLPWKVNVKTFMDIYEEATRDFGNEFINAFNETSSEVKVNIEQGTLSLVEGAFLLIEKTLEYVNDTSPVVVIGLAPPYYPCVSNTMLDNNMITTLKEKLLNFTQIEWKQKYSIENYFTGISDLSYAMFQSDDETIKYIESNMLLWGDIYHIPLETIKNISMPVLNIGPWGKDLHKYTERVCLEELYYKTPILIQKAINTVLNK
ncbi:M20/M25/M40 family metallo-hydrolase [Anaerosalibacter sp. Marseille-P3206]|uniref:M20/M25/M40 family metallo-hydrolase n=1 Tax=Anaerosalibacter sp. Marseille-P3206 TaxID=1871005 RepID=UPI000984B8A1|nr:M20/M25/M40 family metallo-hydrolase [Anaerosalibacter sp. Marseille-P3206]